jgi:hypothetical protein
MVIPREQRDQSKQQSRNNRDPALTVEQHQLIQP